MAESPVEVTDYQLEKIRLHRKIVHVLAAISLVSITVYGLLWWLGIGNDSEIDAGLLALASASVGALAATLTRSLER